MQPALHTPSHRLQPLQTPGSMPIRRNEIFEKRPSSAPTGQTVLQYRRPRVAASQTTSISVARETPAETGAITAHRTRWKRVHSQLFERNRSHIVHDKDNGANEVREDPAEAAERIEKIQQQAAARDQQAEP